jgi:hypothetical protein
MSTTTRVNYRDSGNGQYIPKDVAERRDPRTWQKERVKPASTPTKKPK